MKQADGGRKYNFKMLDMIRENKQTRIKLVENKKQNAILMKVQRGEILTAKEKQFLNEFFYKNERRLKA